MKARGYLVKIHAIKANGIDLLRRPDNRKLDENHT
jgi:hypothetical protein